MRVLRPLRHDLVAEIRRPDDLVGRILDLFAFEQIVAVLVTGKINDLVVLCSRRARAIENRTALPSPPPASRTVSFSGISVGVPVGPITSTSSPSLSK